ncbi:hypothetical protein B9G53_14280, partial [Pseudanabaena sp. SR411]
VSFCAASLTVALISSLKITLLVLYKLKTRILYPYFYNLWYLISSQAPYYGDRYFINVKENSDLVIHNGKVADSQVGVIFETKKPPKTKALDS